ncbi:nucleotide exchange factor for Gsp1p, localizes to the nucleus [Coemansia reversa NRRL 1564]|uniref:Nucleotide exchange factor for Gsp1p, localizes to the nucleus n=1 Tax=Coemansia reversa (strain ATCC 12441 / NRRL 1564) TaxID=763665 RepID=A0A2G5B651_COERN|nr:nucleotide exchange factor for Gsp1p, localizes to the nucleus [Coemansia reversa NRRL 1564]|eukprot:PIA14479.1 nucleotide exchange factor for Gsp1p, localizes to the nucleus [Coemansia reversa NRRL 1564]
MAGARQVGTRSTEDTSAGAKRRKAQNGDAVPVKKAPAAAKKAAPGTRRAGTRTAPVHELAVRADKRGTVFVFGNGDCGQLGLGDDMIERKKPFPVTAIANEAMVDVVSGGLHTVALTAEGQLWSWGCNDQKALGRDGDEFTAAPVEGLDGVRISRVACSDSATFALAEDGHVYAWGTFRSAEGIMGFSASVLVQERPTVINAFREPIVDLCAGVDHALALSASGKVYAWGYGQQGQLGRLVMERRRLHGLTPERLRLLDVHHIGCGSYHSFAVTRSGTVYAWGLNNFHQLGLTPAEGGAEEIIHEPVAVSALKDAGIVKISGGEHHSIALAADGRLYAFGRSDSHQTGLPFSTLPSDAAPNGDGAAVHKKAITAPTLVNNLPPVADFVCGSNHNIALTSDGKAYSWGYGEMLQLGNGEEEDVELPTLLQGQKIDGKSILKVAAGGQHSAILAA